MKASSLKGDVRKMDLKTIKTFKTIVELGNFQRAAEELNYAQSTVTMHIKSLEAELGVILLEEGQETAT